MGGRVHTITFERGKTRIDVDVGASIFVDVNYHLVDSAKKFGLKLVEYNEDYPEARSGMYGGKKNFLIIIWFVLLSLLRDVVLGWVNV